MSNRISLTPSLEAGYNEESFMSAVEENTQYLSALDPDITLEALDEDLGNEVSTDCLNNQVTVYVLEGSEEVYGIQVSKDDEGNMKEYQFQFRTTEDGQLEPIPETVTVISEQNIEANTIEEDHTPVNFETENHDQQPDELLTDVSFILENQDLYLPDNIDNPPSHEVERVVIQEVHNQISNFIKGETNSESHVSRLVAQNRESADIKPDLQRLSIKSEMAHDCDQFIKQEVMYQQGEVFQPNTEDSETYQAAMMDIQGNESVLEYDNFEAAIQSAEQAIENIIIRQEDDDGTMPQETIHEMEPIAAMGDNEEGTLEEERHDNGTESDNEAYETVEGLHITADGDMQPEHHPDTNEQQQRKLMATSATCLVPQVRDRSKTNKSQTKKLKPVFYCITSNSEKENMNMMQMYVQDQTMKPIQGVKPTHPRSLLKCDAGFKSIGEQNIMSQECAGLGIVPQIKKQFGVNLPPNVEHQIDKRFSRSKEAIRAKNFDNFINKTTIPQVPVRQNRLPRKQQIKPVDNRRDEEIIVKEVMVSSEGFVENSEERLRNTDKFEITSMIELSDSEDENEKTESQNRVVNNTVIEIPSDDDDDDDDDVKNPKTNNGDDGNHKRNTSSSSDGSPSKRSRTESEGDNSDSGRREFDCPNCSKSFPSQNSLSTHIQHHNLEKRLNLMKFPVPQYKHTCDTCKESFRNALLLNRHDCKDPKTKMYKCSVCLLQFENVNVFQAHKKSHVKANLMKNTSTLTVSPRRAKRGHSIAPGPSSGSTLSCGWPGRKSHLPMPPVSSTAVPLKTGMGQPSRTSSRSSLLPVATKNEPSASQKPAIIVTEPSTSGTETAGCSKVKKNGPVQCKSCPKVCPTQELLNAHEKLHRKLACNNCLMQFTSRLLLDNHVRYSCVKKHKSPMDKKRLSFKTGKSFVNTSRMSSAFNRPTGRAPSSARQCKKMQPGAKCDICNEELSGVVDLVRHKAEVHGFKTPNKPGSESKAECGSGIRPHARIRAALALSNDVAGVKKGSDAKAK